MIETVPTSLNGSMITAGLILVAAYVLIFTEVIHRMHAAVIGNGIAKASGDPEMLLLTCIILMWVVALLSAIVDNIPFTVTMIPIVLSLDTQGMNVTPLWWHWHWVWAWVATVPTSAPPPISSVSPNRNAAKSREHASPRGCGCARACPSCWAA
ncbi:MAG: SLC13 family permease [Gammaproteobacteria bacterium]|nr:SLC13 family permease [Gammaproteobacteria bacterium]MDH3561392.1 SLC13 family permease [Gammaproteobacteria bacterium]